MSAKEPTRLSEILPELAAEVKAAKVVRRPGELTRAQEKDIKAREQFGQQEYGMESLAYMPSYAVSPFFLLAASSKQVPEEELLVTPQHPFWGDVS